MNNIDNLIKEYLKSDKSFDSFIEEINSMNLGDTPQKSPFPAKYDKDNPEGMVDKINKESEEDENKQD